MLQPFCDDCRKPLDGATKLITSQEIVFYELGSNPRGQGNLHFCDDKCLISWVKKSYNKPNIVTP